LTLRPAITAACENTVAATEIELALVTVVTGLITIIRRAQIVAFNAVTASRYPAIAATSIIVVCVSVVTMLKT
jgi:hypothetical protein